MEIDPLVIDMVRRIGEKYKKTRFDRDLLRYLLILSAKGTGYKVSSVVRRFNKLLEIGNPLFFVENDIVVIRRPEDNYITKNLKPVKKERKKKTVKVITCEVTSTVTTIEVVV